MNPTVKNTALALSAAGLLAATVVGVNQIKPDHRVETASPAAVAAATRDLSANDLRIIGTNNVTVDIAVPAASLPATPGTALAPGLAARAGAPGLAEATAATAKAGASLAGKAAAMTAANGALAMTMGHPVRAASLARVTMPGVGDGGPASGKYQNRLVWVVQVANVDVPIMGPYVEGETVEGNQAQPQTYNADMFVFVDPPTGDVLRSQTFAEDTPDDQTPPPGVKPGEKY